MTRHWKTGYLFLLLLPVGSGCGSHLRPLLNPEQSVCLAGSQDSWCCGGHSAGEAPKKGPKTVFEWAIGKEEEEEEDEDEDKDKKHDKEQDSDNDKKNGSAPNKENETNKKDKDDKDKGNGKKNSKKNNEEEEEEEDEIQTDRPDFTEASTTVGKGRVQLETGYTFIRGRFNGSTTTAHSYPEALLRIGMFAEWFELRLGQNFGHEREIGPDGTLETASGPFDLYLGVKFALTEQKGVLPEMALVVQMTVPSGADDFSADEVLPGINWLYGWDIIKDCIAVGGSTQANRNRGLHLVPTSLDVNAFPADPGIEVKHSHLLVAQSLTINYTLTKKLGAYTEWFALFPHSALDPDTGPEHYFDGGFTYKLRPNLQFDVRAGIGLNEHAEDFFAGPGFSFRY